MKTIYCCEPGCTKEKAGRSLFCFNHQEPVEASMGLWCGKMNCQRAPQPGSIWCLEHEAWARTEPDPVKPTELEQLRTKLLQSEAEVGRLRSALEGVIAVADRKTKEFDAARAALGGK